VSGWGARLMPIDLKNPRAGLAPFLFFFGVVFFLLALQEGCYQKGVKLTATIVAKHYTPGTSRVGSGSRGTNSRYSITYRFTTPEGKNKETFDDVLLQNWTKMNVGDPVNIEYLPATGDSRVAGQTASAPVFFGMSAAALIGGFFLRRSNRRKISDGPEKMTSAQ